MREGLQPAQQQAKCAGIEGGARRVQRAPCALGLRKRTDRDQDGDHAQRHVDAEQPAPLRHGQHRRSDGGTESGAGGDYERVDADGAPEVTLWVGEAHQRTAHAHDAGGPEALDEARDTEDEQGGRVRARERGEREHCQSGLGDAPVAHDLSEGGQRQQYHQDRQLVGVDDPDRGGGRGAKITRDGGQRDVDDGAVEHRHRNREQDGRDSPVAAWQRQAVRWRAGARGADAWSGHPA